VSHPLELGPLFLTWAAMMAAMMVPVAVPNVIAAGRVGRAALFLSGDLVVWMGFSLVAAVAQTRLHAASLLTPSTSSRSAVFSAVLLLAAGVWQFTPMKRACLARCRAFHGSFVEGFEHGAFSLGSCSALMLVLFVVGTMSVVAMVVLTAFLIVEKIGPDTPWISRAAGAVLVAWGAWTLAGTSL
jgi:predicted metal-binding membrane protein